MKFAIVCLLASVSTIKVKSTACLQAAPAFGIQCALEPVEGANLEENNLFAAGMDGEEDLEEDITITGNPYSFLQGHKRHAKRN